MSTLGIKRRQFLSTCGVAAGAAVVGAADTVGAEQQTPPAAPSQASGQPPPSAAQRPQAAPPRRRRYDITIEIVECKLGRCGAHAVGDKFTYPADRGRMCPWLLDSLNGAVRVLEYGGTLPWLYTGTPYQKVIDPEGITTEFIRCPDPTDSGVVAKITRTKV